MKYIDNYTITGNVRRAWQNRSEKMATVKSDMAEHIINYINYNDYTINEFLADPFIYMDSAILGNYIHNPIIIKSVIKIVREHFRPVVYIPKYRREQYQHGEPLINPDINDNIINMLSSIYELLDYSDSFTYKYYYRSKTG